MPPHIHRTSLNSVSDISKEVPGYMLKPKTLQNSITTGFLPVSLVAEAADDDTCSSQNRCPVHRTKNLANATIYLWRTQNHRLSYIVVASKRLFHPNQASSLTGNRSCNVRHYSDRISRPPTPAIMEVYKISAMH